MTVYIIVINDEYITDITHVDEKAFSTYKEAVNYAYEKIKDNRTVKQYYFDEEPEDLAYEYWLKKELTDYGFLEGVIGIESVTVC